MPRITGTNPRNSANVKSPNTNPACSGNCRCICFRHSGIVILNKNTPLSPGNDPVGFQKAKKAQAQRKQRRFLQSPVIGSDPARRFTPCDSQCQRNQRLSFPGQRPGETVKDRRAATRNKQITPVKEKGTFLFPQVLLRLPPQPVKQQTPAQSEQHSAAGSKSDPSLRPMFPA